MASAAVVLAVGARLRGQASSATLMSRFTEAARARVDRGFPVMAINGSPSRLIRGSRKAISWVSPELEIARITSWPVIIPMSPWPASPA